MLYEMLFIDFDELNDHDFTDYVSYMSYSKLLTFISFILLTVSELLPFLNSIKSNGILDLLSRLILSYIKKYIKLDDQDWLANTNYDTVNLKNTDHQIISTKKNIVNISFDNIQSIQFKLHKDLDKINCEIYS